MAPRSRRSNRTYKCDVTVMRTLIKWASRQERSRKQPREKLAADMAAVMFLGLRAKAAVARGGSPRRYFDAADRVLFACGGKVLRQADPLGMTMGVIFHGSTFRRGPDWMSERTRCAHYVA